MKTSHAALAASILALSAFGASASTLLFTYTDSSGNEVSWEQSSNPTPVFSVPGAFTDIAISDYTVITGSLGSFSVVDYYSAADQGGLDTPGLILDTQGDVIYTGSEDAPTFTVGTFHVQTYPGGGNPATLVVAAVGTPEPATWALMLAGFAGLGAAMRMRRGKPAAT